MIERWKRLASTAESDTMGGPPLSLFFATVPPTASQCLLRRWPAWIGCTVVAAVFALWTPYGCGQTAELTNLRAKFELNLAESTLPTLRDYAEALTTLEKQAVAARDYDPAGAVRSEHQRVTTEIASQEKLALLLKARQTTTDSNSSASRILLKISDAKLEGVTLDAATQCLTGWAAGASATWKLPDLPPGGYEVILKCSSGPLEGGTVQIKEAFYSLTGTISTTMKGVEEQNLGTLKIRDGSGTLKITALTVLKSNLMQLQSVELLPANR